VKIMLNSPGSDDVDRLKQAYQRAVRDAVELFVVTAYLTDWDSRVPLSEHCRRLVFVVGTDFGLTRKQACRDVLAWLPAHLKGSFFAADEMDGFHPKLAMWSDAVGGSHLVLGSSNLSRAAFDSNIEANVLTDIGQEQYEAIVRWIETFLPHCSPVSEDWLDGYREMRHVPPPGPGGLGRGGIRPLRIPRGQKYIPIIEERRNLQRRFGEIEKKLAGIVERCAQGSMGNDEFYSQMMATWGEHPSRFQGRGFEISGKHANWRGVCEALNRILKRSGTASTQELDALVRSEIDAMTAGKRYNPTRRAWLSEMLCHFLPQSYPLVDGPVQAWLRHIRYRAPRGATEGASYVDLAVKMRKAIAAQDTVFVKDMTELDSVIWKWHYDSVLSPR